MPLVVRQCTNDTRDTEPLEEARPHLFNLLLLSQCPQSFSDHRLREYEWKLQYAQGLDALEEIQQNLCLCSYLWRFKDSNIRGQGACTRAHNTLNTVKEKIKSSISKYHVACMALTSLSPGLEKTGWDGVIRVLRDENICALTVAVDGQTEGQHMLSWIWQAPGVSNNQDEDL